MPKSAVALIRTTSNLQSLCIKYEMGPRCAYTRSLNPIVNNLSHLRLFGPSGDCKCTWTMFWYFCGTILELSSIYGVCLPRDEPLQSRSWICKSFVLRWIGPLSLLHTPTLRLLDIYFLSHALLLHRTVCLNWSFRLWHCAYRNLTTLMAWIGSSNRQLFKQFLWWK